jgi:hypothetical protein
MEFLENRLNLNRRVLDDHAMTASKIVFRG